MTLADDVFVDAEDPSKLEEAEAVPADGLTPSDHLTDFRQQYEIRRLEHKLAKLNSQITQESDRHKLRKWYSLALFGLVLAWVINVWVVVALQGIGGSPKFPNWKFRLSDPVLIAYITSTTASILGLFGIAAYWLFGSPKAKPAPKAPPKSGKKPSSKPTPNGNP